MFPRVETQARDWEFYDHPRCSASLQIAKSFPNVSPQWVPTTGASWVAAEQKKLDG